MRWQQSQNQRSSFAQWRGNSDTGNQNNKHSKREGILDQRLSGSLTITEQFNYLPCSYIIMNNSLQQKVETS